MRSKVIDSHIHLDWYEREEQRLIIDDMEKYEVEALVTVSNNLSSARKNLKLSMEHANVHAAFGFHPEQELPAEKDTVAMLGFMEKYHEEMIAIGEVGLPYYLRRKDPTINLDPYVELLDVYVEQAKLLQKPIILHAVYEDAQTACDLLEKHSIQKAHFHWFKGDDTTLDRLQKNGYFISITPDVLYEKEIKEIAKKYPLSLLMVETDGPWSFEGPFQDKRTYPKMIHEVVNEIAKIKGQEIKETYEMLYNNTKEFYEL